MDVDSQNDSTEENIIMNNSDEKADSYKSVNSNTASQNTTDGGTKEINVEGSLKRKIHEENDQTGKKPRQNSLATSAKVIEDSTVIKKENSFLIDTCEDEVEYYLTISNLPSEWSYVEIKNYFDTQCGPVDELEMLEDNKIRLTFQELDKCKETMDKLQEKKLQGKKIEMEMSESTMTVEHLNEGSETNVERIDEVPLRPWRPDENVWDTDPLGTYGLRPELLKALKIVPPLQKWVYVSNFRCDKSELREVMELAGNVMMCQVIMTKTKYANVMYSHPLEAVQAISMLNDQMFYGTKLKVNMLSTVDNLYILPKGLSNIGLGFGLNGKPLRTIVQEFQRYAQKRDSYVNPILFSEINEEEYSGESFFKNEEESETVKRNIAGLIESTAKLTNRAINFKNTIDVKVDSDNTSENSTNNVIENMKNDAKKPINQVNKQENPTVSTIPTRMNPTPVSKAFPRPTVRPNLRPMHMHRPTGPNGPMVFNGPRPGPGPFMTGPGPRPYPGHGPSGPHQVFGPRPAGPAMNYNVPYRPPMGMNPGKVMVEFTNLPPSTTFATLSQKLSNCGQLLSVQLTTPGCAIATFGHPSHAERCFQTFHGMAVEGYVIGCKYV